MDSNPPSGEHEFLAVALHEIGHLLGFASYLTGDGSYIFDPPSIYDRFITDASGDPLTGLSQAERLAVATSGNGLFFAGANGVAANGGFPINLNAPPTFISGTSVGHISGTFGGHGDDLMSPDGGADRPSAIDLGVLRDLGWDARAVAVPEPGTMSLFWTYFLVLGFVGLKRRSC